MRNWIVPSCCVCFICVFRKALYRLLYCISFSQKWRTIPYTYASMPMNGSYGAKQCDKEKDSHMHRHIFHFDFFFEMKTKWIKLDKWTLIRRQCLNWPYFFSPFDLLPHSFSIPVYVCKLPRVMLLRLFSFKEMPNGWWLDILSIGGAAKRAKIVCIH